MVVMPLSLKVRANNYKPETDAHYRGKKEIKNIKKISQGPALNIPDLDAFIKSYKPLKEMGLFKDTSELRDIYKLNPDELLMKCNSAASMRIDAY
eukprot:3423432-Pleurochrysis_carterae.AAC.1